MACDRPLSATPFRSVSASRSGRPTPALNRDTPSESRRTRRLERLVGSYSSMKHVATHALSSTTWMTPRVIVTEMPSETCSFTR